MFSAKQGVRVLAVDDCPTTRMLLQAALDAAGHSVQLASSGQAALDAAGSGGFDAVVLDVEMPGLDGFAVGRALRQDPATAAALIVMHTSMSEPAVRDGFAHFDAYVGKPVGLHGLGALLSQLVQARHGTAQACPGTSRADSALLAG